MSTVDQACITEVRQQKTDVLNSEPRRQRCAGCVDSCLGIAIPSHFFNPRIQE